MLIGSIGDGKGRRYEQAPNEAITFFASQTELDFAEMEVGYLGGLPLHLHPEQVNVSLLERTETFSGIDDNCGGTRSPPKKIALFLRQSYVS